MKPNIPVRTATSQDNILLARQGLETFEQAFAAQNTPEDMAAYLAGTFSPELQAAELADPHNLFWLIYTTEVPVGYVKISTGAAAACLTQVKALKIARFYLLQVCCSQGIGSAVLRQVQHYARKNGFASVWLTVWEHNPAALALYQKLGFKMVGDEDFVLGQDVQHDFVMDKKLI
ncbi:GNAT family N-acetyltransferase [Adhaeribacter aerolatus]|uniref:GNAT family N-acetyltransferase n=1 Tax=Adhaeribacter aerolatus TaxID=670289 RepID=UPI0011BF4A5A|nr:GNAT family N-acetyltransferase [Adhaeribacter aerolatus]